MFKRRKPDDSLPIGPSVGISEPAPAERRDDRPLSTARPTPPASTFFPATPQEAQAMGRSPFPAAPSPPPPRPGTLIPPGPPQPSGQGSGQGSGQSSAQSSAQSSGQSLGQPMGQGMPPAPGVAVGRASREPAEKRTLVVGRGISVQGTVQDAERLVVEGTVEASMIQAAELHVAPGGVFRGEVQVQDAELAGTIDGTLTARGNLVIRSTGRLLGTARCRRLQVEDGGQVTGRLEMLTDQAPLEAGLSPAEPFRPAPQMPEAATRQGQEAGLSGGVSGDVLG